MKEESVLIPEKLRAERCTGKDLAGRGRRTHLITTHLRLALNTNEV